MVGEDLINVKRLTRIFYKNNYFNYPLTPLNALFGVGLGSSIAAVASYGCARATSRVSPRQIASFEDWVVDKFGRRLFETFFKTYTKKVWGISCQDIGADWAGQRSRD